MTPAWWRDKQRSPFVAAVKKRLAPVADVSVVVTSARPVPGLSSLIGTAVLSPTDAGDWGTALHLDGVAAHVRRKR